MTHDPERLTRGDFVRVTAGGVTVDAMVALASGNGDSIMLMFDGIVGGFVGSLPALREVGEWRALNGMPLTLERRRDA